MRAYEVLVRNTLPTIRQNFLTRWTPILTRLADRLSASTTGARAVELLNNHLPMRTCWGLC